MIDLGSVSPPGPALFVLRSPIFRSSRTLWLYANLLLVLANSHVALAQISVPTSQSPVQRTASRVTAILPAVLGPSQGLPDLLYVNAPTVSGNDVSVTAGLLLNRQGFANRSENQIIFHGVSEASAALADLNADGHTDLVFGLSPLRRDDSNFCVYYGGSVSPSQILPWGGSSGCMTLPTEGQMPEFAWTMAAPYTTGGLSQVFLVDRANAVIYVVANYGSPTFGGVLAGFNVDETIRIPSEDGAGPIYAADFNGDGKTDLIVNNQRSFSITFYAGNGDGSFQAPVRTHAGEAHSILLHDMDGDGLVDLVVQTATGAIQIFRGTNGRSFPFASESLRGTAPEARAAMGPGGHLAAIGDVTQDALADILVTTAAGLDVLEGDSEPKLAWKRIDDTGLGRSAVVLADFDGDGTLDLAVDSADGVAILRGNGDGTFGSSPGYARARQSPVTVQAQQNTGSTATVTSLALCVGPSAACPITSIVVPPYAPAITMFVGQAFNGSASASSSDGSVLDPASTITFTDSFNGAAPVTLCTLGIRYGSTCPPEIGTTVGTAVGTHVFVAVYSGDATHAPSASAPVTLTVAPDEITAYTLVPSANPSPAGQAVTVTANLTGIYASPTGTYPVLDGGAVLGLLTLVPVPGTTMSTGTFTTAALGAGGHTISAPYPGNINFRAAVGPSINEVINAPLPTVSRLVSSVDPSTAGRAVTFTDTVTLASGGTSPIATGAVTFLDGTSVLGTSTLNGAGVAVYTTSALSVGSHTITAISTGDVETAASSASLVQVITAVLPAGSASFSVTVTPNPVGLAVGNSAELTVRVAPVGEASPAAVTLSCAGLPKEVGCTFSNPVIPAGGGTTTLIVSTTAPHGCASTAPYFTARGGAGDGGRAPLVLPALAALFSFGLPGHRRRIRCLVALATVGAALQISGCGTCIVPATQPGSYTMQVTGVSAVGTETEGTSVVVNVHF